MRRIQDLRSACRQVASSNYPTSVKKALLEGIFNELKSLETSIKPNSELSLNSCIKEDRTNTNFTSVSHITLSSCLLEQSSCSPRRSRLVGAVDEELELKILERQRAKCFLNEEIELLQDDYYNLQKILLDKKDLDEQLGKQIAQRRHEITKKSCRKSGGGGDEEKKSLSARFKHFFRM